MCCMYATYEVISQMRKPWSGHDKNFKWPIWPWTFDLEMVRNTLWSNGFCVYLILSESVKYGWSYRADMAKTSNDPCDLDLWSWKWCAIHQALIPFIPCRSVFPFLRYSINKIWPRKSKVKVMDEVKVQSHNVGPTFYRLTSLLFHVNRPSHTWDMTFFKIWPWKFKVKVMGEVNVESHSMGPSIPEINFFINIQFHSTSNGINPSSDFRDMASIKSGPSAASFDRFWAMGKLAHYHRAQLQV